MCFFLVHYFFFLCVCAYYVCSSCGARQLLTDKLWLLGSMQTKALPQSVADLASDIFGPNVSRVSSFLRLQRNSEVFYSKEYTRVKIRNSYTISYHGGGELCFGQILYFILVEKKAAAVISVLKALPIPPEFTPCKFIVPVETTSCMEVVDVCDIVSKCIFVEVSVSTSYVVTFPSSVTID